MGGAWLAAFWPGPRGRFPSTLTCGMPLKGGLGLLAAYSISQAEMLSAEDRRGLDDAGFSLPGSKKRGAEHLDAPEPAPEVEDLTHDQLLSGL